MLDTARKQEIVSEFGHNQADSGSSEVQIALLSERISGLTSHMQVHKKDHHSRRGLLLLVSQRKALLEYLKRKNEEGYRTLIERLGIRK